MSESASIIICYSACLWCRRRTPHEVCHAHATELGFVPELADTDALWGTGRDQEPETCTDPSCPVWEPGEWEHKQAWVTMTSEQRQAETDRINREIAARRHSERPAADAPAPWGRLRSSAIDDPLGGGSE